MPKDTKAKDKKVEAAEAATVPEVADKPVKAPAADDGFPPFLKFLKPD